MLLCVRVTQLGPTISVSCLACRDKCFFPRLFPQFPLPLLHCDAFGLVNLLRVGVSRTLFQWKI